MMMILAGRLVNLVVALSNVFGILFFRRVDPVTDAVVSLTIVASILMHLSDQKHGLPGIPPFNGYSRHLLWWDRIMAYMSTLLVVGRLYGRWRMTPTPILGEIVATGSAGLVLMFVSEVVITDQWVPFTVTHCAWHLLAYRTLSRVLAL